MLSRALILATALHLIGCFAAAPVHAQNLEAGKSPSQIFAGACNECHKSPRGLLKTVPAGSLSGFLREHYTTSPAMAGLLSSYLISNGAADPRYQGKPDKAAKSDGRPEGKPGSAREQFDRQGHRIRAAAPSQEPAKPDAEEISPPGERGSDGRKLTAKQRLSKRGKPGEGTPKGGAAKETGKTDAAAKGEPAAAGSTGEDKPAAETVRDEGVKPSGQESSQDKSESSQSQPETSKPETSKPETSKSETAKIEAPKEPAPPVTPAPAAAPAASGDAPEPAKPASTAAVPASSAAQSAATESAPSSAAAPAAPAGAPLPPISR